MTLTADQIAAGWIEWLGGTMPVDGDIVVEAQLRSGARAFDFAKNIHWDRSHRRIDPITVALAASDIIAYRIFTPTMPIPSAEEPVDPRITDDLIHHCCSAALRSAPSLECLVRAVLNAGLRHIEEDGDLSGEVDRLQTELDQVLDALTDTMNQGAIAWYRETYPDRPMSNAVPQNESETRIRLFENSQVQSDLVADRIITEILVHGFDNDADVEKVLRPYQEMIARSLRSFAANLQKSE